MASPSVGLPLSAPAPLTTDHVVEGFDCGEPALDHWLAKRALKNESRFSRTYVICQGDRVAAYYSLSAGAVARAAAPGRLRRNAPDTIPVSIIGRLAVDRASRATEEALTQTQRAGRGTAKGMWGASHKFAGKSLSAEFCSLICMQSCGPSDALLYLYSVRYPVP